MLEWRGDAVNKDIKEAIAYGCFNLATSILVKAKQKCPRDTGVLSNSGTLSIDKDINAQEAYSQALTGETKSAKPDDINEDTKKIFISFNTPYAHRQHEELTFNHPQGEAKYLEKAWNEEAPKKIDYIKKEAQKRGLI